MNHNQYRYSKYPNCNKIQRPKVQQRHKSHLQATSQKIRSPAWTWYNNLKINLRKKHTL
ncbi:hypothetical protein DCAR_0831499 [Daucus carota subsp. sativus]|uniref:Uncharacterized protein n=1 Tax=Daucus carota subsp. sativus TaxID=79200 RepID=A0A175YP82_DAUCS|nr:hypothetical protein DCAR_0831499 [Daucus carota subsp. sativus]